MWIYTVLHLRLNSDYVSSKRKSMEVVPPQCGNCLRECMTLHADSLPIKHQSVFRNDIENGSQYRYIHISRFQDIKPLNLFMRLVFMFPCLSHTIRNSIVKYLVLHSSHIL